MRAALGRLRVPQTVALIVPGTAGCEFLLRGTERHAACRIVIWCPNQLKSDLLAPELAASDPNCTYLWPDSETQAEPPINVRGTPERDRAAIAWADEIIVLGLRSGGNLHKLLRERLQLEHSSVFIAIDPSLQSRRACDDLMKLGAQVWSGYFDEARAADRGVTSGHSEATSRTMPVATQDRIIPCPPVQNWDYLVHATRACPGPWPCQTIQDYVDSLLDCRADGDHSSFGSIMRIVQQRCLLASSRTIRGGFKVVSFTETPLSELPGLRTFRVHRARWDFEPYGICIRRERLIERGARAVFYATDDDWSGLSVEARPYFQRSHSDHSERGQGSVRDPAGIDWSVEKEWRQLGDLSLDGLSHDDAILFVPTLEEARKLLEISRWPVTVL
jgi:hypothetical protein